MENNIKYASFSIRAVASFIDTILLALPVGFVIYFLSGGEWFDFSTYQQNLQMALNGDTKALSSQPTTSFKWELLFEVSVLVVTTIFWKQSKGATPGKKLLHIKVVDAKTFKDISTKQSITRSLGYIPSTLLFGIGFLMVLFKKDKKSLHDLLAQTAVIYEEK